MKEPKMTTTKLVDEIRKSSDDDYTFHQEFLSEAALSIARQATPANVSPKSESQKGLKA